MVDKEQAKQYLNGWYNYNYKQRKKSKPEITLEEYIERRKAGRVRKSDEEKRAAKLKSQREYMKRKYREDPDYKKKVAEAHKRYLSKLTDAERKELFKRNYLKEKERFHNSSEEEKQIARDKRTKRMRKYRQNNVDKLYETYCKRCAKEGKEPSYTREEYIDNYYRRSHNTNWDASFLLEEAPFEGITEEERVRRNKVLIRLRKKLRNEGKDVSHLLNLSRIKKPPYSLKEIEFLCTGKIFQSGLSEEEAKRRRKIYDYFRVRVKREIEHPTIIDCYMYAVELYKKCSKKKGK